MDRYKMDRIGFFGPEGVPCKLWFVWDTENEEIVAADIQPETIQYTVDAMNRDDNGGSGPTTTDVLTILQLMFAKESK